MPEKSTSTRKRPRVYECCKAWDDLAPGDRARWEWQVVHQWSHSRIPFSPRRLADVGRVVPTRADALIEAARRLKWIWRTGEGLFVGRLAARR